MPKTKKSPSPKASNTGIRKTANRKLANRKPPKPKILVPGDAGFNPPEEREVTNASADIANRGPTSLLNGAVTATGVTEQEEAIERGTNATVQWAAQVRSKVDRFIAENGYDVFVCPFDRREFRSKAACTKHINANFKAASAEAKATNKEHLPRVLRRHPTIPQELTLPPEQSRVSEAHRKMRSDAVARESADQRVIMGDRNTATVDSLMRKPEFEAIKGIPLIPDSQLRTLALRAMAQGRNKLLAETRKRAVERGVAINV